MWYAVRGEGWTSTQYTLNVNDGVSCESVSSPLSMKIQLCWLEYVQMDDPAPKAFERSRQFYTTYDAGCDSLARKEWSKSGPAIVIKATKTPNKSK